MAVSKQKKVEIMNELVAKFKEAKSIWFATTNTITVEEFSKLRKSLREVKATYTLAKKTIIKKALQEAIGIEVNLENLPGQIWVVCSNEDAIAWLGKTNDFMKEANGPKWDLWKMSWAMSIFEWEVKDASETKILASMPSRETLLGRLVWSMKSPISKLARFFDAAAKEVEKQWKTTVSELEKDAKAVEAPKEEVKEDIVPAPEEPVEEVKSEEVAPETTSETPEVQEEKKAE